MTIHRIYVATSWRNQHQPTVVDALRVAGHEVYDFRHPSVQGPGDAPDAGFAWQDIDQTGRIYEEAGAYRDALRHPAAQAGFLADHAAMEWADTLVMVQPCGRSAHLELGWACGRGKSCWVLLEDGVDPELMLLEVGSPDRLCTDLGELLDAIDADESPNRGEEDPNAR